MFNVYSRPQKPSHQGLLLRYQPLALHTRLVPFNSFPLARWPFTPAHNTLHCEETCSEQLQHLTAVGTLWATGIYILQLVVE